MMTLLAQSLVLSSATLLNSELPTDKRLKELEPYFSPSPAQNISIDLKEERERKKLENPHMLKGHVVVSPPSGFCFTISTRKATNDFIVCKEQKIPFQLRDLQPNGKIFWQVKTGPDDFGTELYWNTSYRIVNQVTQDMPWPGPSVDTIFKSCTTKSLANGERKLEIDFFHRKKWFIRLPEKDQLANPLGFSAPKLYVQKADRDNSLDKIAETSKKTPEEMQRERERKKRRIKVPSSIETEWQMHPRGSYSIPSRNLVFDSSPAGESLGSCRYKYSEYRYDRSVGALECHNVGPFKWLYMPLPCLKDLNSKK